MTPSPPTSEPRWPSALAVLGAVGLYMTLPETLVLGPSYDRFVIPALELAVLVPLTVAAPHRQVSESGARRKAAMLLTALISIANALALAFLIHELVYNTGIAGRPLLYGAFDVWVTNVIVFGLWYWELDGGGPPKRLERPEDTRDFAFVQMTDPEVAAPGWQPRFADYLYVSFTNASAFSPTDTMPLTHWAKLLMMLQSVVSILTLLLVAARAVNILH
jgi:uncharacterized membrane protein